MTLTSSLLCNELTDPTVAHGGGKREGERGRERERGKKRKEKKERQKDRKKERELTLFLLDLSTAPMLCRDFGKAEAGGPIISLLSIHSHPLSADQFQAIMLD